MTQNVQNLPTFFTPIINSKALMSRNGEYFEAPLYHRHHELFVQVGKAFIKLTPNSHATSKTGMYWRDLDLSEGSYGPEQGKLVWFPAPSRKRKKAA